MSVDQLSGRVREFASYLNGLLARLDQGGGWCGVFWRRDPGGMRACLDGREVPPWDVVEALLHDLAAAYGHPAAAREAGPARKLHAASLAAHDARPGGRDALGGRLDVMLREQRRAAERQADLGHRLGSAATPQEAESLRLDLAWAQDDHDRATARCAELRRRMDALDHRAQPPAPRTGAPQEANNTTRPGPHRPRTTPATPTHAPSGPPDPIHGPGAPAVPVAGPGDRSRGLGDPAHGRGGIHGPFAVAERTQGPSAPDDGSPGRAHGPDGPAGVGTPGGGGREPGARYAGVRPAADRVVPLGRDSAAVPSGKRRSKRRPRGSARFAGVMDVQEAPGVVPDAGPVPATSSRSPRGARFAGAADAGPARVPERHRAPLDEADRRIAAETAATLGRLRAEGRSGEAHALLVDAAHWPAARYPLLAAELHGAGLDADWVTLLWEAASLSAADLVAAADALTAAGHGTDGEQMLRQGVVRPADEIGEAVLGLSDDGRGREAGALLDAYVRIRTPEEAARSAAADPQRLVPLLLEAARGVSDERHWDLVHALRVAGFTA